MKKGIIALTLLLGLFIFTSTDVAASSNKDIYQVSYEEVTEVDGKIKTKIISEKEAKAKIKIKDEFKKLEKKLKKEKKLTDDGLLVYDTMRIISDINVIDDGGGGGGGSTGPTTITVEDEILVVVPCTETTYYYCKGIVDRTGSITKHEMTVNFNPNNDDYGHMTNKLTWFDAPYHSYNDYMAVFVDSDLTVKLETIEATARVDYDAQSWVYWCGGDESYQYENLIYEQEFDYYDSTIEAPNAGTDGGILWTIEDVFADEDRDTVAEPGARPHLPVPDGCAIPEFQVNTTVYTMKFDFKAQDGNSFDSRGDLSFSSEYAHQYKRIDFSKIGISWLVELDLVNLAMNITESFSFDYDSKRRLDARFDF